MKRSVWNKLKNYFLAGLIAILPLWVTYFILRLVFKFTAGVARPLIKNIPYVSSNPLLLDLVSFVGTLVIVMFFGVLLTNVVGRRFFFLFDKSLQKVPLLSWVYSAIRKLTTLFYQEDGESQFKRVVMLEYPRKGIYVIGFLTTDALQDFNQKIDKKLVNVFLPTTPNPTSGFLLMVPKEDVIPLEISTEDAVKLIVSGGIAEPGN